MNRTAALLIVAIATSSFTVAHAQPARTKPAQRPTAAQLAERSIAGDSILRDIRELASDRFLGRSVGTAGEDSATAYISRRYHEIGLEPAGADGSFIQPVPLVGTTSRVAARATIGGRTITLATLEDVVAWSQHPDSVVNVDSTDVVFVGYGVVAPEIGWDDFKDVDVRGKTVIMLVGDPPVPDPKDSTKLDPKTFRGVAMTYYGRWTYKYEIAAARGAAAVLLVHQTAPAGYGWSVVQSNARERFEVTGGPAHVAVEGWIQLDAAKRLFAAGGHDFAAIERQASTRAFRPVALGGTATFHVQNRVRRINSRNVVARLAGSDAARHDEAVLLSAHWDGFGIGRVISGDSIYNGALDDASGVAWLLASAKALRSLPIAPRRTIVFAAFTAEEQGLLGARYYAQHPVVPLARTIGNVNMDAMNPYGRTRTIISLGYGQSSLEDVLVREAAKDQRVVKPDAEPEKGYYYRADHLELARGGVPALSFLFPGIDYIGRPATYGDSVRAAYIADDYHKPTDEVKSDWHMDGIVDDTRLTFRVVLDIANGAVWPTWNAGSEFRAVREASVKVKQP